MARRLLMFLLLVLIALIIALGIYYLGSQKKETVSLVVGLIQTFALV